MEAKLEVEVVEVADCQSPLLLYNTSFDFPVKDIERETYVQKASAFNGINTTVLRAKEVEVSSK